MGRCFNFEPVEIPNFEGFKKEDLRIEFNEVYLKDKHIGRALMTTKDENYTVFTCTDRTGEFRGIILTVDERRNCIEVVCIK